jgi:hypothetical protein
MENGKGEGEEEVEKRRKMEEEEETSPPEPPWKFCHWSLERRRWTLERG